MVPLLAPWFIHWRHGSFTGTMVPPQVLDTNEKKKTYYIIIIISIYHVIMKYSNLTGMKHLTVHFNNISNNEQL